MAENEIGLVQKFKIKIVKRFIRRFMPMPFQARHQEYTVLSSLDDDISHPSDYLIDLSIQAIQEASKIRLDNIVQRFTIFPIHPNPNEWPGDHYRLLAAFVKILKPKVIIEIGTHQGVGTLSLKHFLPQNGELVTFDVIPWDAFEHTLFTKDDFKESHLIQYTDDLSDPENYKKHKTLLERAELIVVDARKDGKMEKIFIDNFNSTSFLHTPVILFDDIKHWQMLKIWRDINHPKIDLTSFGHFTGTGAVEWNNNR